MLDKSTIIWSKGFLNNSYSKKKTEQKSSESDIIQLINSIDNVIYIRNGSSSRVNDLDIFSNNLNLLKKPCILITSDGDKPIPSSCNKNTITNILSHNMIKKWYTQNYDRSVIHSKLSYYPIGFDLHTNKWLINNSIEKKIDFMINCRQKSPTEKRISNKIFSDTHNSVTHPDRKYIQKIINDNNLFILSEKRIAFADITKEYNKYNFVISPRGAGLDCHRTWELFLAGVIVITKTSSLDEMFINNNLPVVILKDWDYLKKINKEMLDTWYNEHISKTNIDNIFPKLMYKHWIV
jgi:hypothetical protein